MLHSYLNTKTSNSGGKRASAGEHVADIGIVTNGSVWSDVFCALIHTRWLCYLLGLGRRSVQFTQA